MVICFHCGNTQIWENGELKSEQPANQSSAGYVASVLAAHHVALPQ